MTVRHFRLRFAVYSYFVHLCAYYAVPAEFVFAVLKRRRKLKIPCVEFVAPYRVVCGLRCVCSYADAAFIAFRKRYLRKIKRGCTFVVLSAVDPYGIARCAFYAVPAKLRAEYLYVSRRSKYRLIYFVTYRRRRSVSLGYCINFHVYFAYAERLKRITICRCLYFFAADTDYVSSCVFHFVPGQVSRGCVVVKSAYFI